MDNSIWAAGSVTPEPASGTRYSEDLTAYGFSVDTAPYPVNVADTDEPTAWNVLDLFAHPTGTFAVDPASIQVSNDGLTVAYEAERASGKVWRVVSKKHGTKVDIDAGKFDEVWLAPDGELFAALSTGEVNAVRARIIRTVDGEVLNEYEDPGSPGSTTTTYFKYMGMAESGGTVWLRREYRDGDGDVFGSTVVALGATTVRTWDVGPVGRVARADVSADGRFMVTDILGLGAAPEGPSAFTTVYDFLSDESGEEALPDGPAWEVNDALVCLWVLMSTPCTVPMKPARAEISDDGLIVATTTWTRWGWFEYSNPGA